MTAAPPPTDDPHELTTVQPGPSPVWTAALRAMARIVDTAAVGLLVGVSLRGVPETTLDVSARTAILTVALLVYAALSERFTGTTPGKRLFRLHVGDPEGARPGLLAASGRNVLPVLAATAGIVGLIIAVALGVSIVGGAGRGFHDRFAGLRVSLRPRGAADGASAPG